MKRFARPRGQAQTLARLHDNLKAHTDETIEALTLQAKAWRQLAIIACADPERARGMCQMMLFNTVPWVNGEYVGTFINDHIADAEECGKRAGVFTS